MHDPRCMHIYIRRPLWGRCSEHHQMRLIRESKAKAAGGHTHAPLFHAIASKATAPGRSVHQAPRRNSAQHASCRSSWHHPCDPCSCSTDADHQDPKGPSVSTRADVAVELRCRWNRAVRFPGGFGGLARQY